MSVLKKITVTQKAILVILLIIIIDQVSKIWIKTHFELGGHVKVTSWFYIYFIENEGMAFGLKFINKLFLTLFRIAAVSAIGYFIYRFIKKSYPQGFILCMALIFAGAFGNIIDSIFYGVIFDHSNGQIATMFPEGGGYAPLFYGRVVDMLYFPIIDTTLPDWFPFWGGEHFVFFSPVFNLADSAITIGVILLIIFYRHVLMDDKKEPKKEKEIETNEN